MEESVKVIQVLLESPEGKQWFLKYLRENLKLEITAGVEDIGFHLRFNNWFICSSNLKINARLTPLAANYGT